MLIQPPQSPIPAEGMPSGPGPIDHVKKLAHHLAQLALLRAHSQLGGGSPPGPLPSPDLLAQGNLAQSSVPSPGQVPFQNTGVTAPELDALGMHQAASNLWAARHPNNNILAAKRAAAAKAVAPIGF